VRFRLALVFAVLLLIVAGVLIGRSYGGRADAGVARPVSSVADDVVAGKYIVSLDVGDDDAALVANTDPNRHALVMRDEVATLTEQGGGKIRAKYDTVMIGFTAEMSPQLAERIDGIPGVRVVHAHRVRLAATQTVETRPPYGLDRISERAGCLNEQYTYSLTGKGVHVYVIDTGIVREHPEFASAPGVSRVSADVFTLFADGKQDALGHGTHVAGTIGGKTFGVAKEVTLHSARVFGDTNDSDTGLIIKAVDWATGNAAPYLPYVVVNMSLISPRDSDLENAIRRSRAKGLTYVVAAGNYDAYHPDRNACHWSPSHMTAAITVGAINPGDDSIAPFSFVGGCVDIFAPGVYIKSANSDLAGQPMLRDGASMATAHVSGIAALYLETAIGKPAGVASPDNVWKAIDQAASVHPGTPEWGGISNALAGSPNKIAHWGSAAANGTVDGETCPKLRGP
jgi:subtilisin family serine protease